MSPPRVVIIIPCFNEGLTVDRVVADFRSLLPEARVVVYDNNSTDDTVANARKAGADVRHVLAQGKGHVVRRAFADEEADIYLLVDGDGTYDAAIAPEMVRLVADGLDLVNAARLHISGHSRRGHEVGNRVLTRMVEGIFRRSTPDILSGFKAFSRRFVKSFPAFSGGFEIETELTVHALSLMMPMGTVEAHYGDRPAGSESKLSTFGDGFRILRTIAGLVRQERPLAFFSVIAIIFAIAATALGIPVITTYFSTHKVPRLPTALLATSLMLLAFLSMVTGLILDTVTRGRKEAKMLSYLRVGTGQSSD